MALKQHINLTERYDQQVKNARTYLIPFIEEVLPITPGMQVMEIGCDLGGVLTAFLSRGAQVVGVDLKVSAIEKAKEIHEEQISAGVAQFIAQNVYEDSFLEKWQGTFDLILLKDTIEHIPDQESFIPYLKHFLRPEGKIFFGFPPWRMPFGGHQQICQGRWSSKLPYYHLLPRKMYERFLYQMGEKEGTVEALLEIKDTGISINRFEKILRKEGFSIDRKNHYLINPIYQYKFGIKPRKQASVITAIPYLRDYVTTCVWYVTSPLA